MKYLGYAAIGFCVLAVITAVLFFCPPPIDLDDGRDY